MIADEIKELPAREPFQPFRIRASSGEGYDVADPGLVVAMKSQILIAVPRSDRYSIIPYLHVAGIEVLANGHAKRRGGRKREG